jgi:hypothetical protein
MSITRSKKSRGVVLEQETEETDYSSLLEEDIIQSIRQMSINVECDLYRRSLRILEKKSKENIDLKCENKFLMDELLSNRSYMK